MPCVLSGCAPSPVVRVFDGVAVAGPYIPPSAYAAYARGVDAEARGDRAGALAHYRVALARDEKSVELWTRVGTLDPTSAGDVALERAEALDPDYAPLHRARAERALGAGDLDTALAEGLRAVALDGGSVEATVELARLCERGGRSKEAWAFARELVLRHPGALASWKLLGELAASHEEAAWVAYAQREVERIGAIRGSVPAPRDASAGDAGLVDAALVASDLPAARRASRAARLPGRLLAPRALALGRADLAREEAALVLAADPDDLEARLSLAVALDLSGETAGAEALLARAMDTASAPGELATLLMAELLARHVGRALADEWLRAATQTDPELPADLRGRLRARLAPAEGDGGPPRRRDAEAGVAAGPSTRGAL